MLYEVITHVPAGGAAALRHFRASGRRQWRLPGLDLLLQSAVVGEGRDAGDARRFAHQIRNNFV